MSSRTYLQNEARWARQQEAEVLREIDDLRDERTLDRKRKAARHKTARAKYDFDCAKADEARLGDLLPETIARKERDLEHWRNLAREYEDRICDDEDQLALEEA